MQRARKDKARRPCCLRRGVRRRPNRRFVLLQKKGARNAGLSAGPRPRGQSVNAHEIVATTEKLEDSSVPRAVFEACSAHPLVGMTIVTHHCGAALPLQEGRNPCRSRLRTRDRRSGVSGRAQLGLRRMRYVLHATRPPLPAPRLTTLMKRPSAGTGCRKNIYWEGCQEVVRADVLRQAFSDTRSSRERRDPSRQHWISRGAFPGITAHRATLSGQRNRPRRRPIQLPL